SLFADPKPAPKYSRDFTFPTEATPIRELPVWEWPFLGANNHNAAPHRAKRQVVATSDDIQLSRCAEYLAHGAYTHPRLLFVWYGDDQPSDPVEFLRTVLTNDLGLGHLAFSLQRVKEQPNRMLFELSSRLQAFEVLRNYCQLFSQTATYRAHGYDD
ncbi:hypothetical protein KR044_010117, partial [Drosophila immigrans]